LPAGSAEPRHADALPDVKRIDAVAQQIDAADDFVARHNGKPGIGQLAINDVQVGAAHPARRHPHSDFSSYRPRIGPLHQSERLARPFQNHCQHAGNLLRGLRVGKAPRQALKTLAESKFFRNAASAIGRRSQEDDFPGAAAARLI
jgi:hypothetical protein